MTVIPLGAGLPRRSSHLPADLSEPLIARQDCACSIRLFGVAPGGGYRVSPAAQRQTRGLRRSLVANTRRLVSVALFLVFAKGKPSTITYGR